jgi:hypothetical protein
VTITRINKTLRGTPLPTELLDPRANTQNRPKGLLALSKGAVAQNQEQVQDFSKARSATDSTWAVRGKEIKSMPLPAGNGVQSPLNLILPIKSWVQLKELQAVLHIKTRAMLESSDKIGTLHFARFFQFHDNNQLGFFTVYDGSFESYMNDFLKYIGPVFDFLEERVVDGPPIPVEKNAEEWIRWTADHQSEGIGFYSAYPTLSVQDIRTRAGVTRGAEGGKQSPLALVLNMKSPEHLMAARQTITQSLPKLYAAADAMDTVHFARFIPMGTTALALISDYDGDFEAHVQDLATHLGPMFDELLENAADPPPRPVQKNVRSLVTWVSKHNIKPWIFYTAYPTLSVQDVRAKAGKAA